MFSNMLLGKEINRFLSKSIYLLQKRPKHNTPITLWKNQISFHSKSARGGCCTAVKMHTNKNNSSMWARSFIILWLDYFFCSYLKGVVYELEKRLSSSEHLLLL